MTPKSKITFINPTGGVLFAFLICIPVGGAIAVVIAFGIHLWIGG